MTLTDLYNTFFILGCIWVLRSWLIWFSLKYNLDKLNRLLCLKCMSFWGTLITMGIITHDIQTTIFSAIIAAIGGVILNKIEY